MSIAKKTASAGAWVVSGKLFARCLDMVTLLVLSRILTPADFGLVAMAMSVVLIAEAMLELPLVQALVRIPELTRPMFDTAFTLGVLRGLALALVLGALAWPLSWFYAAPDLPPLICALALAPILRGTVSPRMVLFMREMDFRREFALDFGGKLVALVVAVGVALVTRSHWAIAAATISTPLTMNVLSYVFAPYRPRLSLAEWGWFRNMVGWNSVAQVFMALNWQMDRLMLGRFVSQASLGRFTMASDLVGLPNQVLVAPLLRPLMAAFSLRADPAARGEAYLKVSNAILMTAGSLLLGMALLAEPMVRLALGKSWDPAAPILMGLGLITLPLLIITPLSAIAMTMDMTRMLAIRMMAEFALRLPTIAAGIMLFGIPGVIGARALTAPVTLIIGMSMVRNLTGISIARQFGALRRTILALAAMAVVLLILRPEVAETTEFTHLLLATAGVSICGGTTFVVALAVSWLASGRPEGIESLIARKVVSLRRPRTAAPD